MKFGSKRKSNWKPNWVECQPMRKSNRLTWTEFSKESKGRKRVNNLIQNQTTKQFLEQNFRNNQDLLPEHIRDAFWNYLFEGLPPGSFVEACICNNFKEAACRADGTNGARLREIALFVINGLPNVAQGSEEKYRKWIDSFRAKEPENETDNDSHV